MTLSFTEKIRLIMIRREITSVQLARLLGTSRQNISNKLKKNNFSEKEMKKLAELLNCQYIGPVLKMNDTGEVI